MKNHPADETKNKSTEPPAPEVLKPQNEDGSSTYEEKSDAASHARASTKLRHVTYRPSHRATFIGLAVVVLILALNAIVIFFVIKGQTKSDSETSQSEVIISSSVLDKLGVSRNVVGDSGTKLIVGPNATFNGTLEVGGTVSIGGELKLNSKFSASSASLTKLEAGDTSIGQLNVNGDATISSVILRKDLTVAGATRLQGPVTASQLFTVNNNMNVSGSLSVGGVLSVNTLSVNNIVAVNTLTVGGHIITRGSAPSVSAGPAVGNNGTVSISGNDAAGTVAVNTGTGAGGGIVANISFNSRYGNTPHVVITAIGNVGSYYINRNSGGFSIGVGGPVSPGGYAFDYIVMQ